MNVQERARLAMIPLCALHLRRRCRPYAILMTCTLRKAAVVFSVLTFVGIFVGFIYGAVTTGEEAIVGGWVILALSMLMLLAAFVSSIIWRLRQ